MLTTEVPLQQYSHALLEPLSFKFPANQANGCPVVRLAVERAALGKSLHGNMAA